MEQIRLLVDAHVFDGKYQGSRTYLEGLYKAFIDVVEDQHLPICIYMVAEDKEHLQSIFGIRHCVKYVQLKKSNRLIRLAVSYPRLLKSLRIHIAHFQYMLPFYPNCKYINTIHDLLFLDFPQFFSLKYRLSRILPFKWSYQRSAIVLTVSTYCKQRIIHHYGSSRQVEVIENGVSETLLHFDPKVTRTQWLAGKKLRDYILCVSRFEPRKNQHSILHAFVKSNLYLQYDLLFIGAKSELYHQFDTAYNSLNDMQRRAIQIWDKGISQLEMLTSMKFANLLVYPSHAEGFGLPPLEAFVLGTPVLCNKNTAMEGFVFLEDGLQPLSKSLDDKLLIALEGKDYPGIEAREMVASAYNWRSRGEALTRLIIKLASE